MTRPQIVLEEWESNRRVDGVALTKGDRALAEALGAGESRIAITELHDCVRIDANSWVGVVHLAEFEIQVIPKYVGGNLGVLRMLEYSSGLGALARLESARTLAAERDGSLVDLLALLLAEASIGIAKRGVLHDYVTREEALRVMRGRLLAYEQVTRRYGQLDRLECRFDELETDIIENQILSASLAIAKRVATDENVRRLAGRAYAVFSEVADPTTATAQTPELDYNRRNEHYRSAHVLARMFLRSLAVNDLYSPGSGDSFAFLLDMNRLFEDFVTRLLSDAFEGTDVRVRRQRRDRTLITDARTGRPYAAVIPDVILQRTAGTPREVPVDAKYKLYDDKKVDQADIYQTFFYAWAYAPRDDHANAPAFILYPGRAGGPGVELVARAHAGGRGATITAIPIDVPRALEALRDHCPVSVPFLERALLS